MNTRGFHGRQAPRASSFGVPAVTDGSSVYCAVGDVGYVDSEPAGDDVCYAALLPDGPPVLLRGSAAEIWRAAVRGGSVASITADVADEIGVSARDIEFDVREFLDDLVARGLLALDMDAARDAGV